MSSKSILVLNGHPGEPSLSDMLTDSYAAAARRNGHTVHLRRLSQMQFDPDFGGGGYKTLKPLEPDLQVFSDDLAWAEHIVIAAPMWWGGLPAKLKGLFDRVFLPGTAFDPRQRSSLGMPAPLLTGRTGRFILTSDTPGYFQRFVYGNAIRKQMAQQVLGFVGIKPMRYTHLAGASAASEAHLARWSGQMAALGAAAR